MKQIGHIYWVLVGPQETPSSRIHGLRVHDYLVSRGWQSHILFAPPYWMWDPPFAPVDSLSFIRPCDVVICQKICGPNTRAVLDALKSLGVRTIYLDCDLPVKAREARLAAMTVCSSQYLSAEYRREGCDAVRSIPDAYEWSACPAPDRGGNRLRCVWFGSATPRKWAEVQRIQSLIAATSRRWTMVTVSDHPASDVKWALATAWKAIAQCDAAVLPCSGTPGASAKSSNKAIQAMALGLPVIAHPIPAYQEVIRHGRSGFLCREDYEWIVALKQLEDSRMRLQMSRRAYRFARRWFSIERIGKLWEAVFADLGLEPLGTSIMNQDSAWRSGFEDLDRELRARVSAMLRNRVRFSQCY